MRNSTLKLLISIYSSCALFLSVSASTPPTPKSNTGAPAASAQEKKAAKNAYDSFLSFSFSKTQKAKNLEMLGAFAAEDAMVRIKTVLERVLGQNSEGYEQFLIHSQELKNGLDELLPDKNDQIPLQMFQAVPWMKGNFDRENRQTFFYNKEYTDRLISDYEKKGKRIPNNVLKDRLDEELAAFDIRYKPIIKELKSINKLTILFDSLTLLDFLYINALK